MNWKNLKNNFTKRMIQLFYHNTGPSVLNVFTTNRCNFSCSYCSRNISDNSQGKENRYKDISEFKFDDLKILLSRYPTINEVAFVGIGEPFMLPHIADLAEYAKKCGKKTTVITNGTLLHNFRDRLSDAFDVISISLHGFSADELSQISRVSKETFSILTENIKEAVELSQKNRSFILKASVVLNKTLMKRAHTAAEFCCEHGIAELDLHNYLPYGLDDKEQCIFDDDDEWKALFKELTKEFENKLKINPPILIKRDKSKMKWNCISFFRVLRVDGLGQVSGCNCIMIPKKENGDWKEDNNVWNNIYFSEMRQRFKERKEIPECCRYCGQAQ